MAEADAVNRFCQKKSTQFEVSFSPASTGFSCTFGIPGVQKVCHAAGSSKKNAQAAALKQMYDFLSRSGMLDQVLADGPATKKRKVAEKSPVLDQAAAYEPWSPPVIPARGMIPRGTVAPRAGLVAGPAPLRPGAVPGTSGTASVKPAAPQLLASPVEDDAGNFTLAIARGHLNEYLKKWGQRTDIKVVADGPSHAPTFKAMLSFQVKGQRFNEMHHAGSKKQATNELALKVCRKLFARGLLPKYKRNSTKGTFFDNLKDSQYFESSSFGVGLPPNLKERLRNYLEQHSYEVHHDVSVPPGTVLWEASMPEEDDQEVGSIAALPWSSPEEGPSPWPEPKGEALPDTFAAAIGAEASANLPIASKFQEIIDTVAENQVSIIQGSTGSGKTTQVPQYILDSQDGHSKTIVVTQPRRLAAITVARRVAAERGEALGGSVGYAVRFDAVWPQRPRGICYMTSGLLLKRLHQRGLCGISHVIVDEVHERDLDNDVLLGLLRSALVVHPELKVVLMSATIDARKFQAFLRERSEHAPIPPVIAVQGHSYDVRCLFLEDIVEKMKWTPPPQKKEKEPAGAMNSCNPQEYSLNTVKALQLMPEQHIPLELARDLLKTLVSEGTVSHETGSVLVFLPTWAMMSSLSKLLQADTMLSRCKVIMLHSQVPKEAQMEAFQPAPEGMAKVILATNIAESSVTIDDVTCVIDSCKVKLTFFTETTRLSYHDVVFTGRHNLEQRKGRAGRTRPGLCFRLCTRRRFEEGLEDEVPPELTRMPLVGAALLVKSLELGDIAAVLSQCPDPPPETSVAHAIAELKLVRALDEQQNLTYLGRILARLPLDPHVGVALLLGHWLFGLGDVMATICAAMSFDEPFQFAESAGFLPWKIQEKYKGTHKNSDQFVLGLVHQEYARIMDTGGEAAAKRFCVQEGLHPAIMRQAYNASEQLRALLQSDALGGLAMGSLEDEEGTAAIALEQHRNYSAIRDWNSKEWCWGAVLLSLVTALPHLAVHQEKRHVWVAEDTIGAVYRGSINCCKNSYVFPSPIFAFLDQVKEGGWRPTRCRQLTNMPPLLALLKPFANGEIRMDEQDGSCVIIGNWIPLGPVHVDTVNLLLVLRRRLEDTLCEYADGIAEGAFQRDNELTQLLQDLLGGASLRFREPPVAAPPTVAAPQTVAAPRGTVVAPRGTVAAAVKPAFQLTVTMTGGSVPVEPNRPPKAVKNKGIDWWS